MPTTVSTGLVPTEVHVKDITGYTETMYPEFLKERRSLEVACRLAQRLVEREYRDELGNGPGSTRKVLGIVKRWIAEAVTFDGGTYPGLLLLHAVTERSVEKIKQAIVAKDERAERLLPVFDAGREGSTDWVDFDTTRPAHVTDSARCHVSHVVVDSGWELTLSTVLEDLPGVAAYVKNDHLGFTIPYTYEGRGARYVPDFLARLTDGGDGLVRTLLIEVSGGAKQHHSPGPVSEKADTARHLWVPAVNRYGQWGRWGFVEVGDPSTCSAAIARAVDELASSARVV